MNVKPQMLHTLDAIKDIESAANLKVIDVPFDKLGGSLIDLYYLSTNLRTRELIRDFMQQAGPVWLRKLITRDNTPQSVAKSQFAGMDEYLGFLASNDDEAKFVHAC